MGWDPRGGIHWRGSVVPGWGGVVWIPFTSWDHWNEMKPVDAWGPSGSMDPMGWDGAPAVGSMGPLLADMWWRSPSYGWPL